MVDHPTIARKLLPLQPKFIVQYIVSFLILSGRMQVTGDGSRLSTFLLINRSIRCKLGMNLL